MSQSQKSFDPPPYQCTKCLGVIKSQYSGHFCQCPCGHSFVDQTPYYMRVGGNAIPYEEPKE